MHKKDEYPEIWAAMEAAKAELEPLMAKRKEYTDQIDLIGVQIGELIERKDELNKIAMADIDEIRRLRKSISRFAIAMGAESLK